LHGTKEFNRSQEGPPNIQQQTAPTISSLIYYYFFLYGDLIKSERSWDKDRE
jgi:hypothetical protein